MYSIFRVLICYLSWFWCCASFLLNLSPNLRLKKQKFGHNVPLTFTIWGPFVNNKKGVHSMRLYTPTHVDTT